MTSQEVLDLVEDVQAKKAEFQTIEVKAAHFGCPKRLYDTLSSFSNQDAGGIIVFGLDEEANFNVVGVYDARDLQKHVTEQCDQMSPVVRAVFSSALINGKQIVTVEIPAVDITDRPCFYAGKGRTHGSYIRVGDADKPMTEYEIYSYEAYRKKYQDELTPVERAGVSALSQQSLSRYLLALKATKPNLAQLDDQAVLELMSVFHNNVPTIAGLMLFGTYPQAYFPQLSVIATVIPGNEPGSVGDDGARFSDNRRIEGTLSEQLEATLAFIRTNTRVSTTIDQITGQRIDRPDYPVEAVRELVLNALIHRDYSVHTQGMPIQVQIFSNRLVITNPSGLYGRLAIDELGKVQPDTRNPVIATAMETLGETENRYSGIPTVRRIMSEQGRPAPLFETTRGEFRVTLFLGNAAGNINDHSVDAIALGKVEQKVVAFCQDTPRSRAEIARMLGVQPAYAMRRYVTPLVERGLLTLMIPETPRSRSQRYVARETRACSKCAQR